MNLTKDGEFVMQQLYKVFADRVADGGSKIHSKIFAEAELVHSEYFPEMTFDNFMESIHELSKNELINCSWEGNVFVEMELTERFISEMEK